MPRLATRQWRAPLAEHSINTNGNVLEASHVAKGSGAFQDATRGQEWADDFDKQVAVRCASIQAMAEQAIHALRAELQATLKKLPASLRAMTLKDFSNGMYQAIEDAQPSRANQPSILPSSQFESLNQPDVGSQDTLAASVPAVPPGSITRSTRKRAREMQSLLDQAGAPSSEPSPWEGRVTRCRAAAPGSAPTPGVTPRPRVRSSSSQAPFSTPAGATARLPQVGEMLLSVNGSPLGAYHSGGLTPHALEAAFGPGVTPLIVLPTDGGTSRGGRRRKKGALEHQPIVIQVGDGRMVPIARPADAVALPEELRNYTKKRLLELQGKLKEIMASMEG